MNIDFYLFRTINSFAKKSRTLDFLAIFSAKYLGYIIIALLLLYAFFARSFMVFLLPMACGAVSLVAVNEAVYFFYKRKRPMEVMKENTLIEKPISPAFPSSHTSFFFALSFAVFFYSIPLAIAFLALSFCISFFRIFCGVHWPSDIAGGIVSAGISVFIVALVISFFF